MSTVVCWFQRTLKQLEREQTDTQTDTHCNPRACAPRVYKLKLQVFCYYPYHSFYTSGQTIIFSSSPKTSYIHIGSSAPTIFTNIITATESSVDTTITGSTSSLPGSSSPTTTVRSSTEVGIIDPSTSTSRPNPAGIAVGLYSVCVTAFYTLGEKWVLVTSAVTGTIITVVLIGFFFLIVLFKRLLQVLKCITLLPASFSATGLTEEKKISNLWWPFRALVFTNVTSNCEIAHFQLPNKIALCTLPNSKLHTLKTQA